MTFPNDFCGITQAHRFNEYRTFLPDCGYGVIGCSDVKARTFYDDPLQRQGTSNHVQYDFRRSGIPVVLKAV